MIADEIGLRFGSFAKSAVELGDGGTVLDAKASDDEDGGPMAAFFAEEKNLRNRLVTRCVDH